MKQPDGRGAYTIGSGILLSRLTGLLRNTFFAHYFGAGFEADAYNAAFKIPNAIRNLLGEGTLSAAFVPMYTRMLARSDEKGAKALANAILGLLLGAVAILTLAGILGAPLLTDLLTPGFDDAKKALTTRLTRVLFPMSGLMVISGWCLGIQNSHRRFFWSYASAALWSLAQIVLLVGWGSGRDLVQLVWWLSWATLVGSVLQVGAQLPEVLRLLGPLRPTLDRAAEGVGQTLRSIVPVVTALGVVQISSFVDLSIASFLPEGAASNLQYASLLIMLPVALFGVSVAASSLPEFSRDTTDQSQDALRERLRAGWQRILFYVVPSAVVFIAYGDLCVGILYRSGRFGAVEQRVVHVVLAAFAVGLVSFGSVKLLSSAHYALQDYRTPLRASIVSITVSALASVGLAIPLRTSPYGTAAIALGTALGSYVNLGLQARNLRERLGPLYTPAMWHGTRRIGWSAASALMVAAPLRWVLRDLSPRVAGPPTLLVFGIIYLVVAWRLGSMEAARWLRRAPRADAPAS